MGKDNQPKHRQYTRSSRNKSSDLTLIFCEGEKTEINYFKEIKKKYRVASLKVEHCKKDTAPLNIVDSAYRKMKDCDKIYVVFDRDNHSTYHDALVQSDTYKESLAKNKIVFDKIVSVPCFELWLLLHFEKIDYPINKDDVERKLKQFWQKEFKVDYNKNAKDLFARTEERFDTAKKNADLLNKYDCRNGTDPYTNVDELVEFLRSKGK